MNYSIEVTDVGKAYRSRQSRKDRFKEWFIPFYKSKVEPVWVLQHINFNLRPGESVGIVGMNGAGKSTLLKIITGTTAPTTGSVRFTGRVAALLELGMGFHLDFTGRENIMLAGQLIGMSVAEIRELTPAIEAFAEIGDAMNEPVRTYSSGMQMRLAFSLATAVRPDVLIVDEALSVGDAYFQQKSFVRIRQFREEGTTLLFVSHDKAAVLTLCDRAILLHHGMMLRDGDPASVMDYYNALVAERSESANDTIIQNPACSTDTVQTISGCQNATFTDICLLNSCGERITTVRTGEPVTLSAAFQAHQDIHDLVFGFMIKERTGMEIFGTNTFHTGQALEYVRAGEKGLFQVKWNADLGPGMYSITVALHTGGSHVGDNFQWIDLAVTFTVANVDKTPFVGVSWIDSKISYTSV